MIDAFIKLWTWIDDTWAKAVSSPASPLVFLVAWFQHDCSVCTSWRAMFVGAAVALALAGLLKIAFILIVLVVMLVLVEKFVEWAR